MGQDVRFRSLPVWPHPVTKNRRGRSTFRVGWRDTLFLLEDELRHLRGTNVMIGAGFRDQDLRIDGWPRSDAREPSHPGIELSFDTPKMGRLVYATDACERWEHNVRSIALGLEALRAVDRYGITRKGEQYAGWKALPGTAVGGMTEVAAYDILRQYAAGESIPTNGDVPSWRAVYRAALFATHPDRGGSAEAFQAVRQAGQVLGVAS